MFYLCSLPFQKVLIKDFGFQTITKRVISDKDEDGNEVDEDNVNPGGQESIIVNDHEALRMAPGEGRIPLSVLQDKDSDYLSFPTIFCGER